jgi:threonine aldolase
MSELVDLRSDTVTKPTPAMRAAIAAAPVGDDVYGEDPTVNALEELAAAKLGKPAALFVPSGTMGNQIALRLQGRPGTAVVAGRRQHVVNAEAGAAGVNGSFQLHLLDDSAGIVDVGEVEHLVASLATRHPEISVVCVENTHLGVGGGALPAMAVEQLAAVGVPIHLDGARLWNAAVATSTAPADLAAPAETVMACLSKGLGAPVGSVLAGSSDLIEAARVERKRLGGAMRQAGIIAAAGIVALETMAERLIEDHERAALLAEAVGNRWPGSLISHAPNSGLAWSNMVVFNHDDAEALLAALAQRGVLGGLLEPGVVRLVTHHDVGRAQIESAIEALVAA